MTARCGAHVSGGARGRGRELDPGQVDAGGPALGLRMSMSSTKRAARICTSGDGSDAFGCHTPCVVWGTDVRSPRHCAHRAPPVQPGPRRRSSRRVDRGTGHRARHGGRARRGGHPPPRRGRRINKTVTGANRDAADWLATTTGQTARRRAARRGDRPAARRAAATDAGRCATASSPPIRPARSPRARPPTRRRAGAARHRPQASVSELRRKAKQKRAAATDDETKNRRAHTRTGRLPRRRHRDRRGLDAHQRPRRGDRPADRVPQAVRRGRVRQGPPRRTATRPWATTPSTRSLALFRAAAAGKGGSGSGRRRRSSPGSTPPP